jgi:5-methylcytosine-specific restriction endonuclease McrA
MSYSWLWRQRRKEDLQRAGYRCQRCRVPGLIAGARNLERAHLDGDRTNDAPENTAVLCVRCHKRYDYAEWSRKALETRRTRKDRCRPLLSQE